MAVRHASEADRTRGHRNGKKNMVILLCPLFVQCQMWYELGSEMMLGLWGKFREGRKAKRGEITIDLLS